MTLRDALAAGLVILLPRESVIVTRCGPGWLVEYDASKPIPLDLLLHE